MYNIDAEAVLKMSCQRTTRTPHLVSIYTSFYLAFIHSSTTTICRFIFLIQRLLYSVLQCYSQPLYQYRCCFTLFWVVSVSENNQYQRTPTPCYSKANTKMQGRAGWTQKHLPKSNKKSIEPGNEQKERHTNHYIAQDKPKL